MRRLYVLYDANCGLCSRIRRWVEKQPALVELEFIAATSSRALRWFPTLTRSDPPEELVVVSDEGGVYREDASWIMVLYALEEYREWSLRLSRPWLLPYARSAFGLLTENRRRLSNWLGLVSDRDLVDLLRQQVSPGCAIKGPS
jgi:predicted DCC family thiol-disulfide oxidoreductase YuxK